MYSRGWQVNGSSIPNRPCSNLPTFHSKLACLVLIMLSISDGTRTPLCDTRKDNDRTHISRAKNQFPIPINTDHLFFCNASSRIIKCEPTFYYVLPLHFCHLTFSVYRESSSTRELSEFLTICRLVTARNILSFEL